MSTTTSKPKVLFVLTSHKELGSTGRPTGWYLPEFAHPYEILKSHALITVASPNGGEAPLDPSSVEASKEDKISQEFLKNEVKIWENTEKLSSFIGRAPEFAAIFYVGGHGPMFDLANDPVSKALIAEFYEAGKIVSAVCHGPAAFVNVTLSNGEHLVKDQSVTAFSDVEEDNAGLTSVMPFLLETELVKNGAKYVKSSEPWVEYVTIGRGGRLITGQNPASATPIGKAILAALEH